MSCDGCVTYLSLICHYNPPGEGVGPVHSREVPLPLTRVYFENLLGVHQRGNGD